MNSRFQANQKVRYIRTQDIDEGYFTPGKIYTISSVEILNGDIKDPWLNFKEDDTGSPNGHSSRFFKPINSWTVGYFNENRSNI